MRDANAQSCQYLFERSESELLDHLTRFIHTLGAAQQYAELSQRFKEKRGSDFPCPAQLSPCYDRLFFNWANDYGPINILFQVRRDLQPSEMEWARKASEVIQHHRQNEFRLFARGNDDWYPIPVLEKLAEATDTMIRRFLPKIQQLNTWRQCASEVHFVCKNMPSTSPLMRIVQRVGDKFLCDACIDRFSLAANSVVVEKEQGKSAAAVERAKMTASLRFSVLERDGFSCKGCGRSPRQGDDIKLHVDHVYPVAKGGKTELENLQVLCDACNLGKSDRVVEQMSLLERQDVQVKA